MTETIYFDNAATTPVDPQVIEEMVRYLGPEGVYANPASRSHLGGWMAEDAVESARRQVADALNADPREVVWTSGATEANNLALKGVFDALGAGHLITTQTEHKAVLDTCAWLESRGIRVTYLPPNAAGQVSAEQVREALSDDTRLVSVIHGNNETGVLNDIAAIGAVCREKGVIFHTDAAQTAGKVSLDMAVLPVDLVSMSAHKFYGPKGVGALYVRRAPAVKVAAQMHGGGHERGLRSGTLPTHQIVGMGKALALAVAQHDEEVARIVRLRDAFWAALSELDDVFLNGDAAPRLPGHLNVGFRGLDSELLLAALNPVAASSGSACNSATVAPSYVLKAMGLSDADAHSAVRFSLGRFTTESEVVKAAKVVVDAVTRLRAN